KQRLRDAGLKVPSVIALFDWMQSAGAGKESAFGEARRRMEQAASLGAPHIVASPVPDAPHIDLGRAAARYRELLELGSEVGVTPAMEFLGFFKNVYQLEQAVAIAQQAGHAEACPLRRCFAIWRRSDTAGFFRLSSLTRAIGSRTCEELPGQRARKRNRSFWRRSSSDGFKDDLTSGLR